MNKQDLTELFNDIDANEHYTPPDLPIFATQRCMTLPRLTWDQKTLETELNCVLPQDLVQIWNNTAGLVLFWDITYGQWGLVLWTPDQTLVRHKKHLALRPEEFSPGDLIIGEFLGDSDLLVLRANPTSNDFGVV